MNRLNLKTLAFRRRRSDLIWVFKFISKNTNISKEVLNFNKNTQLRSHSLKLTKNKFKISCREHLFSNRIFNDWNRLTEEIVTAPTVEAFKTKLDKFIEENLS